MTTITVPADARSALAHIQIDVADVIVNQAERSAKGLLSQGFGGHGCAADYDIGVYHGDREAAEELLGRALTADETKALETCVRAYLTAATE